MVVLGWISASFLLIIPLAVTPGLIDRYRVIKESLSRAEGIGIAFVFVIALLYSGTSRFREMLRERALVMIAGAGVAWMLLVTLLSTHRGYSAGSLVTFMTFVLVFAGTWYAAPRMPLWVLDLLVPVVLINTTLVILQLYRIWQPFPSTRKIPYNLTATGLLGNPNIVGSYMVLMTIVFVSAALRCRGPRRWWLAFGTLCAVAGVLVSQSRSAVVALVAGLLLLAVGRSVKRAAIAVAAVALLLAIGVALRTPAVMRLVELPKTISKRGLTFAVSGRVLPLLTGLSMARDRPILGFGPGTFGYHYMPYAVPALVNVEIPRGIVSLNFGEAHNDHLQVIVETGLPGYALFLATIFLLVRTVRKGEGNAARSRVAAAMVLPLAGTLLVLCLAQFPLYVAVTRHLLATMAGLLVGWSRTE
jgi:O-antigen ligase